MSKYQAMKTYESVDKLHASATLSRVEDWTGDWLGHGAGLDVVAERKMTVSSANLTSAVQTVASHYD